MNCWIEEKKWWTRLWLLSSAGYHQSRSFNYDGAGIQKGLSCEGDCSRHCCWSKNMYREFFMPQIKLCCFTVERSKVLILLVMGVMSCSEETVLYGLKHFFMESISIAIIKYVGHFFEVMFNFRPHNFLFF